MKRDVNTIILLLRKEVGKTTPAVWHKYPFRVLISTVLSQRTRDANTVLASQQLFLKYKTPKQLANAPLKEIEKLIKPSGFYRIKARRIKEISRQIVRSFGGKVPKTMKELLTLPGVGCKTGACVMVFGYGIPEVPVDVHVAVMSRRLGLTNKKDPNKIRLDLMKKMPKKYWLEINELMVKYGQRICLTRNPKCSICKLNKLCKYYAETNQ